MEDFVVKHYSEDEAPTFKGNGFDGIRVGEDREEAQRLADYINALRKDAERYRYLRDRVPRDVLERSGPDAGCWIDCEASSGPDALTLLTGDDADAAIDAAMLAARGIGAA